MGLFVTAPGVVTRPVQTILVNQLADAYLECRSISTSVGIGATTAQFSLPHAYFDSQRGWYQDALVQVFLDGMAAFVGYLDADQAAADPDGEKVTLTGRSAASCLEKVYVGQEDEVPEVKYELRSYGRDSEWTPRKVLRDIWDKLPALVGARVQLGSVSVIEDSTLEKPPDCSFRLCTVKAAVEQLLAYYGDVAVRERHGPGAIVFLDFFRIRDWQAPVGLVRIGSYGDPVTYGHMAGNVTVSLTSSDAVTRVMGYGNRKVGVISLDTAAADTEMRPVKAWDTDLEADVLANPEASNPGAKGYVAGMEFVFRRWRLPEVLDGLTVLNQLPAAVSGSALVGVPDGGGMGAQMWFFPRALMDDEAGTGKVGVLQTVATEQRSVQWDMDKRMVVAGDPMVVPLTATIDAEGNPKFTYEAARVGITIAVEMDEWALEDSGLDHGTDVTHELREDAMLEVFQRTDLRLDVAAPEIGGKQWPVRMVTEAGTNITAATVQVLRDDAKALRRLVEEMLKQRSRRRRNYDVGMEWVAPGYLPGYRLVIEGQGDYVPDFYTITGVTWELDDPKTVITADNVMPPGREELRA